MDDKEILTYCKKILKRDKYISVAWHLNNQLKLGSDPSLIRRIRAKLLESPNYIETGEKEFEGGYLRIRQVKRNIKERFPLIYDLGIGAIGAIIGAAAAYYFQKHDDQRIETLENRVKLLEQKPIGPNSLRIRQDSLH